MDEKRNQTKLFDQPDLKADRSTFDLSFPNQGTLNFNKLVPTLCKPTLPGDSWHIKTDFFSRWLAMEAPTFGSYSLKWNAAFVANNQLWGGWQQFIGQGDDQSSQYLLPGTSTLNTLEVPYFTTSDVSQWFAKKLFKFTKDVPNHIQSVCVQKFFRKYIRLFVVPLVTLDLPSGYSMTNTYTDDALTKNLYSSIDVTPALVCGSTSDNAFWDDMVSQGYAYEMTEDSSNPGLRAFLFDNNGQKIGANYWDWAFYCHGANLDVMEQNWGVNTMPAMIELPKDSFFPIDFQAGTTSITNTLAIDPMVDSSLTTYTTGQYTHIKSNFLCITATISNAIGYIVNSNTYTPFGYVFDMLPSEVPTGTLMSRLDNWHRTFGQFLIKRIFGRGTLTDYMGKSYSNSLLRQPFRVANKILGFDGNSYRWNGSSTVQPSFSGETTATKGTYNENSDKFEIGVINEVKISILPYLAYHKIWTDYIRDNRYEVRFLYSDPYKSPFLQPLYGQGNNNRNGTYCNGTVFTLPTFNTTTGFMLYSGDPYLNDPQYDDWEATDLLKKITPSALFSLPGFDTLVSLRERRVVHDFFTMVTPSPQYAGEQNTAVVANEVPTLALRLATRLQRFMERSNFVGSDFVKQTLAHWGVKPNHCSHCSAVYLGGKTMRPTVSPVTVTSSTSADQQQVTGEQAAQMYCSGDLGEIDFSCNEHGYIFQLLTVQNDFVTADGQMADPTFYMDYPLPEFADLGMEALPLCRVINTDGTFSVSANSANPLAVFGYVPRYAQWKCSLAEIHGDFRGTLSYWVSKRQFDPDLLNGSFGLGKVGNRPYIGRNFLYERPDYNSFVYKGEDFDHALFDIDHKITCSRLLPMLPTPHVL